MVRALEQSSLGGESDKQMVKPPAVAGAAVADVDIILIRYTVPATKLVGVRLVPPQPITVPPQPASTCNPGFKKLAPIPVKVIVGLGLCAVNLYHTSYFAVPEQTVVAPSRVAPTTVLIIFVQAPRLGVILTALPQVLLAAWENEWNEKKMNRVKIKSLFMDDGFGNAKYKRKTRLLRVFLLQFS
jgi:hypothetical protein